MSREANSYIPIIGAKKPPDRSGSSIPAIIAIILIVGLGIVMPGGASAQTFNDVPTSNFAFDFIETLAASGITSGCGGNNYCPDDSVTRAQMAVFLERGMRGSDFIPPPATGNTFLDVAANAFAAAFIEQFFLDGITGGCGGNNYCPNDAVTRAQMAVFLLRAKHGAAYIPPPASGIFTDVALGSFAVAWIEQLATEGITSGCGGGNYCPDNPVTRAQMAVFLVRTFSLPIVLPLLLIFDESNVTSSEVDESGGQLSLDVPAGARFELSVPTRAFNNAVDIDIQSILSIEGLPEGIVPIAAVRLGPGGSDFGLQPALTVDLRSLAQGNGAIVGFLANDDGSELTFLPPVGPDPIAESAGGGPFTFDVPHFSVVGVAVVDPTGPGLPDSNAGDSVEDQVKVRVTKRVAEEARKILLGEDALDISVIAAEELPRWFDDLMLRAQALGNGMTQAPEYSMTQALEEDITLEELTEIVKESIRYQKLEDVLGVLTLNPFADEFEIAFRKQLTKLNQQCVDGDTGLIDQLLDWSFFLEIIVDLAPSAMPSGDGDALLNLITCFEPHLKVDPTSIFDFVPSQQTISATLLDTNGNTVAFTLDESNFIWNGPGSLISSENPLVFDLETPGRDSVTARLIKSFKSTTILLFGIPTFLGGWSASASGPVTCPDPEDNSFYDDFGMVSVSSQAITNEETPVVELEVTGGDDEITIDSMSLRLTFSLHSGPGIVEASVTGSMSFTQTEVLLDEFGNPQIDGNGNPVTHTSTGTLNFYSSRFANGTFDLIGDGSDSDGCTFEGQVTLRR